MKKFIKMTSFIRDDVSTGLEDFIYKILVQKLLFLLFPLILCSSDWMENQIEKDLYYFKNKEISLSKLNEFYENKAKLLALVKYTILENEVFVNSEYIQAKNPEERIKRYKDALTQLCSSKGLPNTVLLICIGDGLNAKEAMPIFGMCKMDSDRVILLPDYESLAARYQVLKYDGIDITKVDFSWENKIPKLIWRGSTAQHFHQMNEKNIHCNSRVALCALSEADPLRIDAKFTLFVQNADQVPSLERFKGERVSFLDQMNYKYHIIIDGNVSPYTKSGWKLFSNSLVFKPDSKWVQWYYASFLPYVHYIPVKEDLTDLLEKIDWAKKNDKEAAIIASSCRSFAITHLTVAEDLEYLYRLITLYSQLNWTP